MARKATAVPRPDTVAARTAQTVVIEPPRFGNSTIKIVGVSPYVGHKFSQKAREEMRRKQAAGSQANKERKKREPKDFDALYNGAIYFSREGWRGIPASCFRNAMISACRLVGFTMTLAKLSLFVHADGFDKEDGTPLVRMLGEPRKHEAMVRLPNGSPDISVRPMWEEWSINLRVRWDQSQFSASDVVNLLSRAGLQVGIGEGRHDSKRSNGVGWGEFEVRS